VWLRSPVCDELWSNTSLKPDDRLRLMAADKIWSHGFKLDLSRLRGLRFGENKIQNAVLERSLDGAQSPPAREGMTKLPARGRRRDGVPPGQTATSSPSSGGSNP
jgi:hypothetical protein